MAGSRPTRFALWIRVVDGQPELRPRTAILRRAERGLDCDPSRQIRIERVTHVRLLPGDTPVPLAGAPHPRRAPATSTSCPLVADERALLPGSSGLHPLLEFFRRFSFEAMDDNEPLRSGNLEVTSPISATKMAARVEPIPLMAWAAR